MTVALAVFLASLSLTPNHVSLTRRGAVHAAVAAAVGAARPPNAASAFVAGTDQEVSGLVVLRIAEVCEFQEKLLRTIAKCSGPNAKTLVDQFGLPYCGDEASYTVSPGQIQFATGIMLRNSNLDGNLKLMIRDEVPRSKKDAAIQDAVNIMNTFNKLANTAGDMQTFEPADLVLIADIYSDARQKLAKFFDYLSPEQKSRFYNYAADVRKYEEKDGLEGGIERMKL